MLQIIWDTRGYFFWLLVVSLFCWISERIAPWRKEQKAFRAQIGQDFFWLVLNGHYAGVLVAYLANWALHPVWTTIKTLGLPTPDQIRLLEEYPLWFQFLIFLILKDFLEWGVHNLLHRIPWLWEFHKLHHSIKELDWIGNMRFHWMEIVIYRSLTYLPLIVLGASPKVILWIAVFTTLIGHLNHSNLKLNWGPFQYVLNSPRLHVWHHDVLNHKKSGQNFGIIFCLWDFIFGTAYLPSEEQPAKLGFEKMEKFPERLLPRLVYPFFRAESGSSESILRPH
jgi:sterol desaturase/sphingolipid hydroxylase (fatty acid hydroxylase superfamily)